MEHDDAPGPAPERVERLTDGRPRLCSRAGCAHAATTTLTFQYASRTLWLDPLGERDPSRIDLCERHADRLRPPVGWTGHDRRPAGPPPSLHSVRAS